ncbi:glycosyltransferase family 4 protein [Candidatus Woesearchaeota archaeon]|nr:glycosyltransferase family 4 protein [Candidatus Woesearchaeota archaeon]
MKILMLSPRFMPYIGGVEKHVYEVCKRLVRLGHNLTVVTPHICEGREHESYDGIFVQRFGRNARDFWKYALSNSLLRKVDIVHCHDYPTLIKWYLPFRLLKPSLPVFITFHGYEGLFPIPRRVVWERRLAEKLTWGNICVGDFITKWYGTKPTHVTYGGVVVPTVQITLDPIPTTAVFIGRLEDDTGILQYLNALGILKRRWGIAIKLDICGDGSLKESLESLVKQIDVPVTFHGFVTNPDGFLRKAQFAFVSGYLAILEAMANRRLVCAVYENELRRDYLTMMSDANEMMVMGGSAEEIATAIALHLRSPFLIKDKVDRGWTFASNQTWQKVADQYLTLWSSVSC